MDEAFVQLVCPECTKNWEAKPMDLPAADTDFTCPDCGTERSLAEFMRTDRDLAVLKEFEAA
jgi:predicted RNA-binding Zn-ribbon protein involved in translation (DUF1610 family)